MGQKWEGTWDSDEQTQAETMRRKACRGKGRGGEGGAEEMRGTVENVVFQKHSAACKHPLTHAWTLTRRDKNPCILTSGAEQGHIRDAKQPGDWEKRCSLRIFFASLLQLTLFFTSSLLLWVCVSVCSRVCVFRLPFGLTAVILLSQ